MQLTLEQAADLLGKTRRQVVYMIEQGRLPAKKVGGRWTIERADLAVDDATRQRSNQRDVRFRAAVEEALTPAAKPASARGAPAAGPPAVAAHAPRIAA